MFDYRLRAPCSCGSDYGAIEDRNGQACVFCESCRKFQYNAPKHERGLAPKPTRSSPVSTSERYLIAERARFHCELCGRQAAESVMHVGHLISEADVRKYDLPLRWADHTENLAWLCAECNLGMSSRSLSVHDLLVFLIRRLMENKSA